MVRTNIDQAVPKIAPLLNVFDKSLERHDFIASPVLTLADCLAYPTIAAARLYPESAEALSRCPALNGWLERMAIRDSVKATAPQF